ncbi:class I SAM-dependent methyltransferase [Micromonospora matsumotoense]|uniref:class I SAM-dependent methyltransferase n=1 Tax=Micromonospora matsumotoense TaxID=121616 RepID=UPI0033C5AF91
MDDLFGTARTITDLDLPRTTRQSPFSGVLGDCYAATVRDVPEDTRWLVDELARTKGSLLDLCCGGGRLLTAAAAAGCDVVGVDNSPSMIEQATARVARDGTVDRTRVRLVTDDAMTIDLRTRFDAVALGGLTFTLFDPATRARLLRRARMHLRPQGRLYLDYAPASSTEQVTSGNLTLPVRHRSRRGFYLVEWSRHPAAGRTFVSMLCELVATTGDTERYVGGLSYHLFSAAAVRAELRAAGFAVTADIDKAMAPAPGTPGTRWVAAEVDPTAALDDGAR